jgi:hypothetical protein
LVRNPSICKLGEYAGKAFLPKRPPKSFILKAQPKTLEQVFPIALMKNKASVANYFGNCP